MGVCVDETFWFMAGGCRGSTLGGTRLDCMVVCVHETFWCIAGPWVGLIRLEYTIPCLASLEVRRGVALAVSVVMEEEVECNPCISYGCVVR